MRNGLPPDVTLEDLLASILSETAYDWEALPLPEFPIQDFSRGGRRRNDLVRRPLQPHRRPARASSPAEIAVKIPDEARYVPGSSSLPSLERQLPDPTLTPDGKLHLGPARTSR